MTAAAATPLVAGLALAPAQRPQADLSRMSGFLVVDLHGRLVGRIEGSALGAADGTPAAVPVSFGFLWLRRCFVAAEWIEQIDHEAKVVGLRIDRKALRAGRA